MTLIHTDGHGPEAGPALNNSRGRLVNRAVLDLSTLTVRCLDRPRQDTAFEKAIHPVLTTDPVWSMRPNAHALRAFAFPDVPAEAGDAQADREHRYRLGDAGAGDDLPAQERRAEIEGIMTCVVGFQDDIARRRGRRDDAETVTDI